MRKILLIIICVILICFLLPIIFTKKFQVNLTSANIEPNMLDKNKLYDYGNYNKVKLLHVENNQVEEIDLDTYLYGVVSSEMPANYEKEALKAQAVVARTYTIYKIFSGNKHENANICDDSKCCQAWISKEERLSKWDEPQRQTNWEKICDAVDSTKGKIITYEGKPINAFFHSNSGGLTDTATNVWGGTNYPYLQVVETANEDAYNQYSSELIISKEEFVSKIKNYHSDFNIEFNLENQIQILEYTEGQRVKTIKIGNLNLSGVEIRNIFGLKSAKFEININGDNIIFRVTGYGHGVGMSQTGADSLAKQGKNYKDIIKHFYTNVEIVDYE